MKKTLLSAALVALLASPAVAQTAYGSAKVPAPQQRALSGSVDPASAFSAFAYVPGPADRGIAVFERGQYRGQDPDPNIRLDLRRDLAPEASGG